MSSFGLYGVYARAKTHSASIKLRYQLHIAEGREKCSKVPQRRELVIGTRAAGQGSK